MATTTDKHPSGLDQARGLAIVAFATAGVFVGFVEAVKYYAEQDNAEKARFYAAHPGQAPALISR